MTESLGQAFSKACRSRTESWSPSAEGEILSPKQAQDREGPYTAVYGPVGRPLQGVFLGERPARCGVFPIIARTAFSVYPVRWDYVGRHAADRFSSGCPLRLSGGQSQTVQRVADDLMPMLYHAPDAWQTRADLPFWWIDQSE